MDIEWFRDLVISIFAIVATVVLIFIAVMLFVCYRRIKPLVDSARTISKRLEGASARIESEVLRPIIGVVAFARLLYQIIEGIKKFVRTKTGGADGPER